jgi:fumarate hydratase class II
MLPVIAYNLLYSIKLLSTSATLFAEKCIDGIAANEARCMGFIEESLAMCTALAPAIRYEQAAAIAKEAYGTGKTVREVAIEKGALPDQELDRLLDPRRMT